MKQAISIAAGAVVGNYVAERFVLKGAEGDPTGFVLVSDGFGADDIARAACITLAALIFLKIGSKVG